MLRALLHSASVAAAEQIIVRRTLLLATDDADRGTFTPELKPWGLRVLSLFDPAGVLWQISSRP